MADDSSKQNDTANETIYTDPDELQKVEAQILMYSGSKWLEISNTRTTNVINGKIDSVAGQVAEAQKGIATATADAQNAVQQADSAVETATQANETATQVQNKVADVTTDLSTVKDDLSSTKTDLTTTKTNLQSVSDQATQNKTDIATTNSTVSGIQTDFANTKGDVAQLQTTASGLETDMANAKGDITTLKSSASELQTNMGNAQGDITSLTTRAGNLESSMTNAQGDIATLQNTATSLSSEMSSKVDDTTYQSEKTQTANSFNALIATVQNSVDTSAVGTNLLTGTSNELQTVTNATGWNTNIPSWKLQDSLFANNSMEVTFRCYVAPASHDVQLQIAYTNTSGGWSLASASSDMTAGSDGYLSCTGVIPQGAVNAYVTIAFMAQQSDSTSVSYKEAKLERGKVAHDWSANPADNATVTQFNNLSATVDGLNVQVSKKVDETTYASDLAVTNTAIQGKVSSDVYEAKMSEIANDINLKVSTADLLSQINVEAGNILIQSNKIYLDASSVVFGGTAYITDAMIANVSADKIDAGTIKGIEIVGSDYYAGTPYTSTTDGTFYPIQMNDLGFIEKKESNTFVRDTNDMSWKGTGNAGTQYSDVTTFDASSFTTGQVFDIISNINIASAKVLATGTVTAVLADGTTMNIPAQKLMYGQHTYNFRGTWNSAWNSQTGIKLLFTGVGTDVTITVGMAQFMLNENDSSTTNVFSKDRLQITPDGGLIQYTEEASDTNNDTSYVELQGASLNLYSGNMGTHQSTTTVDEYLTRINGQGISFFGNAGYADEATNSRINFYGAASYQDVVNGLADPDGVIMSAWGNVRGFKNSGAWAVEDYTGTRRLEIGLKNDNGFSITSRGAVNITAAAGYQANINATVNVAYALNVKSTINGFWIANNYITTAGDGLWVNSSGGGGGNATVHAKGFSNTSLLSLKTNITEIDTSDALSQILGTKQYHYQFKDDIKSLGADKAKTYTSFIIDDVNTTPEYTEPDEFLADDKKGRDDGAQLAYAVAAIQELYKRIEALQNQVASLSK